jgi:RNA polymerase sigma factor for flagellar operon FliA
MEYLNLWQKFKKHNDLEAKNSLIEKYIEVVKIVAGRLYTTYGTNVEYEDLVSYGIFGLIDAIEKFEVDKNVKFETYSQIRIRGAIIDQLRNLDWVPRSIRQKVKDVEAAYQRIENTLGRNAADFEVAKELNVSLQEFQLMLQQINNLNILSLEEKLYDGSSSQLSDLDNKSPEDIVCNDEMFSLLRNSIDSLPEREKEVISLYYYDELTYKEIGVVLGISESRVSQLHSKAISRLKSKLQV